MRKDQVPNPAHNHDHNENRKRNRQKIYGLLLSARADAIEASDWGAMPRHCQAAAALRAAFAAELVALLRRR